MYGDDWWHYASTMNSSVNGSGDGNMTSTVPGLSPAPTAMPTPSQFYQDLSAYALGYWKVHPYVSLIICTFGISTNIVNILILTRKKMLTPINCILTGIAVSDIITMIDYIPFAIHFYITTGLTETRERYTWGWSNYLAVHSCLSNTTHTISIWLAVCMSAMRYVFIRSKGNSKWNLGIRNTCVMIVIVYCMSVIMFIPNYIVTEVQSQFLEQYNVTVYRIKNLEIYLKNTSTMNAINVWTFIVVGKLIPCFLICIFGGLLLRTLDESKRLTETLKQTSCSQRMKQHKRTTLMLLAIILMFIIAELPSGVLVFVSVFVQDFFMDYYQLFADTLDILSLVNNAVNFVMYCSMSRQFRECLCETIPTVCKKKGANNVKYHNANSRLGTVATNL